MSDRRDPNPNPTPIDDRAVKQKEKLASGRVRYPNPPESVNPDAAALRDQWRFAIKQYSRWYSQAWGSAILAGLSFFALGWVIKGSNPLPSLSDHSSSSSDDSADQPRR